MYYYYIIIYYDCSILHILVCFVAYIYFIQQRSTMQTNCIYSGVDIILNIILCSVDVIDLSSDFFRVSESEFWIWSASCGVDGGQFCCLPSDIYIYIIMIIIFVMTKILISLRIHIWTRMMQRFFFTALLLWLSLKQIGEEPDHLVFCYNLSEHLVWAASGMNAKDSRP